MSELSQQGYEPGARAILGDRYQIHADKPLPQLDAPLAHAVTATDLRGPGRDMFALVCRPDLLPRVDIITQLSRLTRLPMIIPVEAGAVPWPESGGRRFVTVFDYNAGERVCQAADKTIPPLHEDQLVRMLITPLIPALKELGIRHITHRAIRADSLFYSDAIRQSVVLGECVSAPPAMSQPAAFEPIDSAIAKPSARGSGSAADDLYSFGALIAFLLSGGEAIAGKSDEELIEAKILRGSYSALLGESRVSLTMMEPLRGLLCDDKAERWTVHDLEHWVGGRQLSPKQPMLPIRASRPIKMGGTDCWTKPSLYNAMGVHWREAAGIITDGTLERWVLRALSDDETGDALRTMMQQTGSLADDEDRLTSKALIVLEPGMPLRYKGLSVRIDALAAAFAIDFHNQEIRQVFTDLIKAKLPQIYLQSQSGSRADQVTLMKTFDMMNFFLDRQEIGNGVERILYESNAAWPCQSPLIQDQYVYELQDLLPALDRAVGSSQLTQEFVDPHIVAFCAARIRSVPERVMRELSRHDDLATFRLGILHLLAEVQRHCNSKVKLPALCGFLARATQPIIDTYHNRTYKQRLADEVEEAGARGDILELLFLVDSLDARHQDTQGFERAKREYSGHARAIAWLRAGGLTSAAHVQLKSRQAATLISATISAASIVGLSLLYVV